MHFGRFQWDMGKSVEVCFQGDGISTYQEQFQTHNNFAELSVERDPGFQILIV